jgi:hypothetical protein
MHEGDALQQWPDLFALNVNDAALFCILLNRSAVIAVPEIIGARVNRQRGELNVGPIKF